MEIGSSHQIRIVQEEFQYNLPLTEADFSLEPPAGAKVRRLGPNEGIVYEVWPELRESERQRIQDTLTRAFTTHAAGDWAGFSRLWDFSYLDRFTGAERMSSAQGRDWEARFRAGRRPNPVRGLSIRVTQALLTHNIGWPRAVPPSDPPLLSIRAVASFGEGGDRRRREVEQRYLLRRLPGGEYRILKWWGWDRKTGKTP